MIKIFQELTVNKMTLKVDKNVIVCKISSVSDEEIKTLHTLNYIKNEIC